MPSAKTEIVVAAAHVDAGAAEFDFVVDQSRKTAGVRCGNHALDREMGAVDAEFEVLQRGALGRQNMHVDTEDIAEHGERIADATLAIQREACWQRVEDGTVLTQRLLAGDGKHLAQVVGIDFLATEIDGRGVDVALQATGRDVDDQALDGEAGHALGRIDGETDHTFGGIEIGDDAVLHAAGFLVADADDLDIVRAARKNLALGARRQPADHADDLGGADVEDRNDVSPLRGKRLQARQAEMGRTENAHVRFAAFFRSFALCSTALLRRSSALPSIEPSCGLQDADRRLRCRAPEAARSHRAKPACPWRAARCVPAA